VITGDYIRKQVKLVKLAEEFYQMWLVDDRFALYGTCLFPTQGRPITHTQYYISWTSLFFDICSIKFLLWFFREKIA
jgi:hypothetical protein